MNLVLDKNNLTIQEKALHTTALTKADHFKKAHAELLEIIMQVDHIRLFEKFGLTSTFSYCTQILRLSEDVTCTLTKLARVSQKIPELKSAIDEGLSISKAREIAAIVSKENKTEWIEKAKTLSQKSLQKAVAISFPKEAVQEKVKYVAENRLKLELGLDEEAVALLRWAQDFVSQKTKTATNMENTLKVALQEFKDRNDPLRRASRRQKFITQKEMIEKDVVKINKTAKETGIKTSSVTKVLPAARRITMRKPIPASILHQVNLRDQRKCQAQLSNGAKCENSRWLDYHHIQSVQHGGTNTLENLVTLCSYHHRLQHR